MKVNNNDNNKLSAVIFGGIFNLDKYGTKVADDVISGVAAD